MDTPEPTTPHSTPRDVIILRTILGLALAVIVVLGLWTCYAYLSSPEAIRQPSSQHVHLRLQLIVNGAPVNFAEDKFQTTFNQDICTAALTKEPFHFHDHEDQFVHVHWANLTGGLLLKNYGWNFIGGPDTTLGYRFDRFPRLIRVPIHGLALPKPSRDTNYYVYTGTASNFKERSWKDFLDQKLTDFMSGTPVTRGAGFIPVAYADQQQAAELNDVLGNVVILAQKYKPSDQQVKDRFNHLLPIPESQCSG